MQEFFLTYIRGKGFVARDIVRKTWLHRQDEINRLTERNAELEAECELLAEDNDRAQQVITAHWHNLERERNRADKAEATIKRVLNYGDLPEAARYELQQALNGSHEVTGPNIYTDSQQALKGE